MGKYSSVLFVSCFIGQAAVAKDIDFCNRNYLMLQSAQSEFQKAKTASAYSEFLCSKQDNPANCQMTYWKKLELQEARLAEAEKMYKGAGCDSN